jgi:hypothetical protein
MNGTVHRRQKARQDLVEILRYYARDAGLRTARRFLRHAPGSSDV